MTTGIALTLSACAGVQPFSDQTAQTYAVDFPAELTNLMSNSVPFVNKHLTYPRLAVSLTDTRQFKELFLGLADHGHFKVTEWTSPTEMKVIEFDITLTKGREESEFRTHTYDNIVYMALANDNWRSIEASGGNASPDFQPMNTHWSAGPEAAQFFVRSFLASPPAHILMMTWRILALVLGAVYTMSFIQGLLASNRLLLIQLTQLSRHRRLGHEFGRKIMVNFFTQSLPWLKAAKQE